MRWLRCRHALTAWSILALVAACESEPARTVFIDVRTDLRPGFEFAAVRVELVGARTSGMARVDVRVSETDHDAFITGRRVAELTEVMPNDLAVRVSLLADTGRVILERAAAIRIEGRDRLVTVVLTRDCRGVSCPAPDGDPVATACLSGMCVTEECTPEDPAGCPAARCTTDGDCAGTASCSIGRCFFGTCFQMGQDTSCAAGEWCNAEVGCVAISGAPMDGGVDAGLDAGPEDAGFDAGPEDAGPGDAGTEDAMPDAPGIDAGLPVCGNAIVEIGESCDDGNTVAMDGCSATCTLEADSCFDALDVDAVGTHAPDGSIHVAGSLARATDDAYVGYCGNAAPDRIYTYTAPSDGILTLSTDSAMTDFDTVIHARTVCLDATTSLGCDDDGGTMGRTSFLSFPVTAAQQIYAIVDGYNSYVCCAYELIVQHHPYLEAGASCDPASRLDVCRPMLVCGTDVDSGGVDAGSGGFTCR